MKKIWICLIAVIMAAVIVGTVYYFYEPKQTKPEGFLIRGKESVYVVG